MTSDQQLKPAWPNLHALFPFIVREYTPFRLLCLEMTWRPTEACRVMKQRQPNLHSAFQDMGRTIHEVRFLIFPDIRYVFPNRASRAFHLLCDIYCFFSS